MGEKAPNPLFQEWAEEQESQRLESKIQEAGEEETGQLLELKRDESEEDWLRHVDEYVKKCLEDMAAPLPAHDLKTDSHDLERGQSSRISTADNIGGQTKGGKDSSNTDKPRPTRTKVRGGQPRCNLCSLSRPSKVLVRNAITTAIATMLPFFAKITSLTYNTSLLIGIFALVLALRPIHLTTLGHEHQQVILFVILWPFFYVWSLFMIGIAAHNLVGFVWLLLAGVVGSNLLGNLFPSSIMTMINMTITFSVIHVQVWKIYNFEDFEDPFKESNIALGGATFGLALSFFVHYACSLLVFPWSSIPPARDSLRTRYISYATTLRRLRPVYDRIANHTLSPSTSSTPLRLEPALVHALREAHEQEAASIPLAQKWVGSAILETRFLFNGNGLRYLRRYNDTLGLSRNARHAAADIINHENDFLESADSIFNSENSPADSYEQNRTKDWIDSDVESEEIANQRMHDLTQPGTSTNDVYVSHEEERKRIPELIAKINLLLELGAHRMAQLAKTRATPSADVDIKERMLRYLDREQAVLESLSGELNKLAVNWMERYLRSHAVKAFSNIVLDKTFFRRTKLVSYVLILIKLVKAQHEVIGSFKQEREYIPGGARREWAMTFPFHDSIIPTLYPSSKENMYEPMGRLDKLEHGAMNFFADLPWKLAFKTGLGTTLLVLPGLLSSFYEVYSTVALVNAVFTFQITIFKTQAGLVIERVFHRLTGVACGAILISAGWEAACANGCKDPNTKWILYAFEIAALSFYMWMKTAIPKHGYIGYATVRTMVSISVEFVIDDNPADIDIWRYAGYVIASSAIGALGATVLSLFLWPTNGRIFLRETLAKSYHDFVLICEQVLTDRYEHPDVLDSMRPDVAAFEHNVARALYVESGINLRAAHLESMQHYNFDAPFELYAKAVTSTQHIWQALWKLNHLGGLRIYSIDYEGHPAKTMHTKTARVFFAAHRWLTQTFVGISAQLRNPKRDSLPVLRPIVASPFLLNEMLQDSIGRAYNDEVFLDHIVSSRDLALMLNLPLMTECFHDIGNALDSLYEFLDAFLRKPKYADRLRSAEFRSYDVYNKTD